MEFRDAGITLRATVKGAPDRASGDVSAYERQLRTDKVLGPLFKSVTLNNPKRDPLTNRLVIEIICEYKKAPKKTFVSMETSSGILKELEIDVTFILKNDADSPLFLHPHSIDSLQGLIILMRDITDLHRLQSLA